MVHEKVLACVMAELHFGEDAAAVARMLLNYPEVGLAELSRRCELPSDRCRAALCVLMQHGAVISGTAEPPDVDGTTNNNNTSTSNSNGDTNGNISIYRVNLFPLLMRTRQGLYEGLVEKEYGELGRKVLHELFLRGRMTASSLYKHALDPCVEELDLDEEAGIILLLDMASDGVIVWCGNRAVGLKSSDLFIPDPHEEEKEDDDSTMIAHEDNKITVGKGGNRRIVGAPTRDNDCDVWRLSHWYLNRSFRNGACRKVLASRIGDRPLVLDILETGLRISLSREDPMRPTDDFDTGEVSIEEIRTTLIDSNYKLDQREFWEAIKSLITVTPVCVQGIPTDNPSVLKFIPGRLISEVRFQTLIEFVNDRHGKPGKRIFAALIKEGAMDDRMIAEKCMMDVKMVREKCFAMKKDRLVELQEVPRSHETATRGPNWYYLWKVQPKEAADTFLQTVYKTQTNVLLRKMSLSEKNLNNEKITALGASKKNKAPLKKNKIKVEDGIENGNGNENSSKKIHVDDEELRRKEEMLLTVSSVRLDQSIMVMRDFGTFTSQFFRANYQITDAPDKRRY